MFKKLLLAVLMSLMGYTLVAQIHEDPWIWPDDITTDEWSFCFDLGPSLNGGMTLATTPKLSNISFQTGFCYQLGLSANGRFAYRILKKPHGISRIGMGVEILLSSRSIRTETSVMTMTNIEIPILLKYYVSSNFSLETGTTLVMPLKVKPEMLQMQNIVYNVGEMRAADAMLTVGGGYQVIQAWL